MKRFLFETVFAHGRRPLLAAGVLALALAVSAVFGAVPSRAVGTTNILETGSSLLYPLFNLWVPACAKINPGVRITTQSTGSGTGIAQ